MSEKLCRHLEITLRFPFIMYTIGYWFNVSHTVQWHSLKDSQWLFFHCLCRENPFTALCFAALSLTESSSLLIPSVILFFFVFWPLQVCFRGEVHGSLLPRGKTPHRLVKTHPPTWAPPRTPPINWWWWRATRAWRIQSGTPSLLPALQAPSRRWAGWASKHRPRSSLKQWRRHTGEWAEEAEEGEGSTRGRTGAEEKTRWEERPRGVEKSPAWKQKGRSKCPVDQLAPANQGRDLENDLERGVTGGGSSPQPQLLPPPPTRWSSHRWPQQCLRARMYLRPNPRRPRLQRPPPRLPCNLCSSLHPCLPRHGHHLNLCSNPSLRLHLRPFHFRSQCLRPHRRPCTIPLLYSFLHHQPQSSLIPHHRLLDQEIPHSLLSQTTRTAPLNPTHHLGGSQWSRLFSTALWIILLYCR